MSYIDLYFPFGHVILKFILFLVLPTVMTLQSTPADSMYPVMYSMRPLTMPPVMPFEAD